MLCSEIFFRFVRQNAICKVCRTHHLPLKKKKKILESKIHKKRKKHSIMYNGLGLKKDHLNCNKIAAPLLALMAEWTDVYTHK